MAHKKATGSTQLGRDSQGQRLGLKLGDGAFARAGMIIIRQRGTKYRPGRNVRKGADDTLYAGLTGKVKYQEKKARLFNGNLKSKTFVNVVPIEK